MFVLSFGASGVGDESIGRAIAATGSNYSRIRKRETREVGLVGTEGRIPDKNARKFAAVPDMSRSFNATPGNARCRTFSDRPAEV
jgi:hypothetical protein